jgi:hypothetical protein
MKAFSRRRGRFEAVNGGAVHTSSVGLLEERFGPSMGLALGEHVAMARAQRVVDASDGGRDQLLELLRERRAIDRRDDLAGSREPFNSC